jgi:hypothetical protein
MSAGVHDSGVDANGVMDGMESVNLAIAFSYLMGSSLSSSSGVQHYFLGEARESVARQINVLRDDSAPLSDIFLACEDDELFHKLIAADRSGGIADLADVLTMIDERLQALGGCDEC